MPAKPLTFTAAKALASAFGISIRKTGWDAELVVYINGTSKDHPASYFTDDPSDAYATALLMARKGMESARDHSRFTRAHELALQAAEGREGSEVPSASGHPWELARLAREAEAERERNLALGAENLAATGVTCAANRLRFAPLAQLASARADLAKAEAALEAARARVAHLAGQASVAAEPGRSE